MYLVRNTGNYFHAAYMYNLTSVIINILPRGGGEALTDRSEKHHEVSECVMPVIVNSGLPSPSRAWSLYFGDEHITLIH